MGKFFIRRLLTVVPLIFGVSVIVFLMVQLVPGDPVRNIIGDDTPYTPEQMEEIRNRLGLNDPLHVQYIRNLKNLLQGDFGTSIINRQPALGEVLLRIPSTLELAAFGLSFAIIGGVILGIIAALNHNNWIDNLVSFIAMLGVGIPNFWMALVFIIIFSIKLRWLPIISTHDFKGLLLPGITLGLHSQAAIIRFVRSGMLEILHMDYIRTARAKGLNERGVVLKHALRNSMIPVITLIGIQFGSVIAGAAVTETIFNREGMGRLLVNSIIGKDFPVVQAILLLLACSYIIANMLVELAYAYLDPRIRVE